MSLPRHQVQFRSLFIGEFARRRSTVPPRRMKCRTTSCRRKQELPIIAKPCLGDRPLFNSKTHRGEQERVNGVLVNSSGADQRSHCGGRGSKCFPCQTDALIVNDAAVPQTASRDNSSNHGNLSPRSMAFSRRCRRPARAWGADLPEVTGGLRQFAGGGELCGVTGDQSRGRLPHKINDLAAIVTIVPEKI